MKKLRRSPIAPGTFLIFSLFVTIFSTASVFTRSINFSLSNERSAEEPHITAEDETVLRDERRPYSKIAAFVAFDRYDYFKRSFEAFSKADGSEDYDVVVFLDGTGNYTSSYEYDEEGHRKIRDHVKASEWLSDRGLSKFKSVKLDESKNNVGVWKNKKRAVSFSMETRDFAIIIEDDIVLSKDAVRWLEFPLASGLVHERPDIATSTCWSTSFPKTSDPKLSAFDRLSVDVMDMRDAYYENPWSTPWGWSIWKRTWEAVGEEWTGQDSDLARLVRGRGWKELMPLVSRCDNIGLSLIHI